MDKQELLIVLLWAVVNAIAFFVMALDKRRARRRLRRIPERTLLLLAVCGGGIGAAAAMYLYRHKTRHADFAIGLPLMAVLQTALLLFWIIGRVV